MGESDNIWLLYPIVSIVQGFPKGLHGYNATHGTMCPQHDKLYPVLYPSRRVGR